MIILTTVRLGAFMVNKLPKILSYYQLHQTWTRNQHISET